MSYNNEHILRHLGTSPDPHAPASPIASSSQPAHAHAHAPQHAPLPRGPTLAHTLPSINVLLEEAIQSSSLELVRQSLEIQRERELAEALAQAKAEEERKELRDAQGTWASLIVGRKAGKGKDKEKGSEGEGKSKAFERPPQAYELYAAIDKKDLNYIARVRDHAFPLLLQKNAGQFPIIYASRIGASHKDIVILLCGALSRYVNHLDDEDFQRKGTISILRALRVNLKMAIDNSLLPAFDSSLLSSYLQVLIMSEGDIWIRKAVHEVALWLRTWEVQPSSFVPPTQVDRGRIQGRQLGEVPDDDEGGTTTARNRNRALSDPEAPPLREGPVHKAELLITSFCTKELKNVPLRNNKQGGLGVDEYVANSTMDLVLMACWTVLSEGVPGGGLQDLPTYTFARDLRTYSVFTERLDEHRALVQPRLQANKRLKRQVDLLVEVCGDTRIGIKGRVEILKERLDGR